MRKYEPFNREEYDRRIEADTNRQLSAAEAYMEAYEKYGKEEAERIFFEKIKKNERKNNK
jgi:hypothetical protein